MASTILRDSTHPPLGRRTPARNEDFFDEAQLAELRAYARPVKRVELATSIVTTVLAAVLVFGVDVGPTFARWFEDFSWPIGVAGVAGVFIVIDSVLELPVHWWITMIHDRRHGLSNQTAGLWVTDRVKHLAINLALNGLILSAVYWAIRNFDNWWLIGGVVMFGLQLVMAFVYPVVLMPRFNKFTPMPDGELRSRIEEIAELAGASIEGVYTMDGSKRSRRTNAFVAGFGPTKRVVVYDTMLDFPIEEISQVVAHEIGHYRLNHIPKSFPLGALQLLAVLAFVQYVGGSETVLGWAGVDSLGDPAAVPVFVAALSLPFVGLGLLSSHLSRRFEREADLEALELLGDPNSFVALWPRMVELNKADLEPGWWKRANDAHPEVAERMQFGIDWARMNGLECTPPDKATVVGPGALESDGD